MTGIPVQPDVGGVYAVLDTCVLLPNRLSDILFDLALQRCFQPLWTADIEAEFLRNWRSVRRQYNKDSSIEANGASHRLSCFKLVTDQYEVFGYRHREIVALVPDKTDAKDSHVNAAALAFLSKRDDREVSVYVVSFNTAHLAVKQMADLGVTAIKPGGFIDMLYETGPAKVMRAMKQVIKDLKAPPYTAKNLIATLKLHGAKLTASAFAELHGHK